MHPVFQYLDPRQSVFPVPLAFIIGLALHFVDQALNFRAGPVPIAIAAPLVAVFTYIYLQPNTWPRRFAVVSVWAVFGTGIALVGHALHSLSYRLPRPLTEPEMLLFDLGTFLWFVFALTIAYAVAARTNDETRAWIAIAAGPLLQLLWTLSFRLLVAAGLYA